VKELTYQAIRETEDALWWHRVRRLLATQLLVRAGLAPGACAIDIGCGPGGTFELYRQLDVGLAIGFDRSNRALDLAGQRATNAALVCADASARLPFADRCANLVTIFGVLNHDWIKDEGAVFREARRILKPEGIVFVTEPAFPSLMRGMDRFGMTRKRYRPGELARAAQAAGLAVVREGHFAAWAFLPAWILARVERLTRPRSDGADALPLDLKLPPAWLNRLFYGLGRIEVAAILAGVRFPVGVTMFGLYRRPAAAP
jgi:SAM-dependent methyltransferase